MKISKKFACPSFVLYALFVAGLTAVSNPLRATAAADAVTTFAVGENSMAHSADDRTRKVSRSNGVVGQMVSLPLFNTGVAADKSLLVGGQTDPHYTLLESADLAFPGPEAVVASQIADGYWVANGPSSKWIAPQANRPYPGAAPCNLNGRYVSTGQRLVSRASILRPRAFRVSKALMMKQPPTHQRCGHRCRETRIQPANRLYRYKRICCRYEHT